MRDTRPNNADDPKAAIKATWASITPEQCHRMIASMPRRIDAVIHAKGGPTKYWVHRNEHTFKEAFHFCLKYKLLYKCVVVIYCPLGQLGTFLEELDGLLSSFAEDGSPLVFGDFNIHLDRPYAANVHSLLASLELKRLTTTSTHKSGSQLDLIYRCNFVADNVLVKPLHTSDHHFITPSHLFSVVSSSLPSPTYFSALDVNTATDTLCSTLSSCLDHICHLSSRPAHASPSNSWLYDVLREHRSELRAAERKWRKSKDLSDLSIYQSLLSSFSAEVHTAKASYF